MKRRFGTKGYLAILLLAVSALLLVAAFGATRYAASTENVARRVERRVSRRIDKLERYSEKLPSKLPDDMIIYRYRGDSLVEWHNQFTVCEDGLAERTMFHRLINPRSHIHSPMAGLTDSIALYNFGYNWYLAKVVDEEDGSRTVLGLEIMTTLGTGTTNGVNPRFHLKDRFSVKPLTFACGAPVYVEGRPQFKILYDTLTGESIVDVYLIWLAFAFFFAGMLLFVLDRRRVWRFVAAYSSLLVSIVMMYVWGTRAQGVFQVFSPILFAGGRILYSLGAVILVNMAIFSLAGGLYLVRVDLARKVRSKAGSIAALAVAEVAIFGILLYAHTALSSIIQNSNISLELYKFGDMSAWTAVVYVSFLVLFTSIPMTLQMIQPALTRVAGVHFQTFSLRFRLTFSILVAAYIVGLASYQGFRKEQNRLEVVANRLAIDRDISLELQLRRVENQIASDVFIAPLSCLSNGDLTVRNRIVDTYFSRIAQDYDISVYILNKVDFNREEAAFFNDRTKGGQPIFDNSHFLYIDSGTGIARYEGVFVYYSEQFGLTRIMLEVEPKSGASEKGYASIFGSSQPGKVSLPATYSYARYKGRNLQVFRGNYAYATTLEESLNQAVYEYRSGYVFLDGQTHFINLVSDDEAVIISRRTISVVNYLVAAVFIALAMLLLLMGPAASNAGPTRMMFKKTYYRTRINWVIMTSLTLTLVAMALASVFFVYRRNEANLERIMSDKVSSIQVMLQRGVKGSFIEDDLRSSGMVALLEEVSSNTGTDISLYSPAGKVFVSTYPEVFDRMYVGCRIDEDAYDSVMRQHKRFCIRKQYVGRKKCYFMYAPVLAEDGRTLAILCSPYTSGESYEFERDAMKHSMTIISLFLILLLLARFSATMVVNRMFKPLSEMGRKMSTADLDNLELIDYERDDEISYLVKAYNRMVTELSESSKQLAQAERDKAWSGMARQVAHEIKNPLTPMKLQIQRIVRLKQRNDPNWQDKFDEVTKVLLDHIDILTDTANEFSTFAKLYTEEPTRIELDKVLQEEIAMFDNKDNITFEYMGLADAVVSGPKPQLTRVFVNLINNAVQALDEQGGGRILVSLRKSGEDGFYDIVVEDSGPGVSADNVARLFTPNFTTKNGGSGLGLAISRSILERCSATISYSRSFSLGGACFTVKYPR